MMSTDINGYGRSAWDVRGTPVAHPRFSRALMDVIVRSPALFTVIARRGGNPRQVCYFATPHSKSVNELAARSGAIKFGGGCPACAVTFALSVSAAGRNLDTHDHFFGEAGL